MTGNNHKGFILQDRDRHLLRELAVMRVIDREQAKCVAGFGSTRRANDRLLGLTRAGLLRRFFLGTSAGGTKALYALSPTGAELVDVPFRGPRRRQNEILVADIFVNHQIHINQIYCALKYRPIPIVEVSFLQWLSFYEPLNADRRLIPDGYLEVLTPQKTMASFLEVDLGHESLSVWKAKVQKYLRYAVSGNFETRFGLTQFRVLVIADSERRMQSLRAATSNITDKVFWFSTFHSISNDGFWSDVWLRAGDETRRSLL
ncbi:MAG: replication-relaxation family protein [Candidatus Acidiferrales bacterium]